MNKAEQLWNESEKERVEIEQEMALVLERWKDWATRRTILANELGKLGLDVQEVAKKSERYSGSEPSGAIGAGG